MDVEKMLCEEIKKYQDVIIYGYRDIGTCVLDFIIQFDTDIKMSNYSGKVRYFATSSTLNYEHEKKGIPIKRIDEISDYSEDALVIISTQEQHHEIIANTLDELNFRNRFFITHEMYIQLKERVENHKEIVNTRVGQYGLSHEMQLDRLRKKVATGRSAVVYFMTQRAAAFGCASIYKAMEKSEVFDPYILCISKRDIWFDAFYEAVEEDVAFFEARGFRAINAYDEHHVPKDLTEMLPDIIFFDSPNLYGPAFNSHFRLDQINWRFLTCYVPYGLLMVDSFYYHYNNINVRECWKYFLDTPASYNRAISDAEFNCLNLVKAGYPKFDDYYDKKEIDLPTKLKNDRPTVIYAPHWSLNIENKFATFDLYKDQILKYVESHPEINFVFKPHPELWFRIKVMHNLGYIDFGEDDYDEYMRYWESLPNGVCITQGDYISIFKRSCCMITDCGSFIGEYLPSLNPCIYLFNPRKKRQMASYTPLARNILDTYYIGHNENELEQFFETVVINGIDEKREAREALFHREFGDIGHAGEDICNYLKEQIVF